MKIVTLDQLGEAEIELLNQAEKAREYAYNPYSRFFVGATVLSDDGRFVSGCNIENKSWELTLCAERSALGIANGLGIRNVSLLGIITRGENFEVAEPTMPCGACRQFIYEFSQMSGTDIKVISANTRKTKIAIATISELLPYAFGPKDLGINIKGY